jgi:hypothetical protein
MSDANLIRERNDAVAKATALESELFALGVQTQALKERLKLADMMRGALADIADSEDEQGRPSSRDWMMKRAAEALAAFDAVPGDVSQPPVEPPDTRPRYASGEVPMVGDVFRFDRNESYMTVDGIDDGGFVWSKGGLYWSASKCALVRRARLIDMEVVRRAAPPAPDLLARAVALLREHAYDVRVRDFLADFDKGGV